MTDQFEPLDDVDPCGPQTEPGTPLLFARVLDGQGGGRVIDWQGVQDWAPRTPGEVLWIHLCRNRSGVYEWLQQVVGVPEPTAELLTSDATRPRPDSPRLR